MKILIISVFFSIFLAGCANTTVTGEWKDPEYSGTSARSVMVMGFPADSEIGRLATDEFVKQLKDQDIYAVSGYSTTPAGVASKQNVMAKARELGVGMVLVSRFLDQKAELSFRIAQDANTLVMPGVDNWTDDQYYVRNEFQLFRTIAYDPATGKAIWSAVSDTFVNGSEKMILKSYVKAMLKKMEQQGLLKR